MLRKQRYCDTWHHAVCLCVLCISLGGKGNALCPVLSSYLRQVNEVNGGDNVFVRCVSVCVCVCVCARSGRSMGVNANSSKTVKATDFKFGTSLPRDSPDLTPKNFCKRGRGQGHVTL